MNSPTMMEEVVLISEQVTNSNAVINEESLASLPTPMKPSKEIVPVEYEHIKSMDIIIRTDECEQPAVEENNLKKE